MILFGYGCYRHKDKIDGTILTTITFRQKLTDAPKKALIFEAV